MADQVIILDVTPVDPLIRVRAVGWFDMAAPAPLNVKNLKDVTHFKSATQAEREALMAGTVKEELFVIDIPPNTSEAAIKASLLAKVQAKRTFLNSCPAAGAHYGKRHNGTGWSS